MSRTWEDKKREWDALRKEGRDMYDYEEELRMSAGGINLELAEKAIDGGASPFYCGCIPPPPHNRHRRQ